MLTQFINGVEKNRFDDLFDRAMGALEISSNLNQTISAIQQQIIQNKHKLRELSGGLSVYPQDLNVKKEMMKTENLIRDFSMDIELFVKQRSSNTEYLNQIIHVMDIVDKDGSKRALRLESTRKNRHACF